MPNANFLQLFWPHPKVAFNGRGISEAWAEELARYGFEITQDARSCDLAFFISDSQFEHPETEWLIANRPTIAFFWGWPPERMFDDGYRQRFGRVLHNLSRCTRVLVPSPSVRDQLWTLAVNCQECLPGIDLKVLDQPAVRSLSENLVVGFLSRLAPQKNLEALIEAASLLQPRPELLVMGPGDKAPYADFAERLGVKARFAEPADAEKIRLIQECSVLVHPSTYEGFGLPPLEALYLKVPVIAWDTPHMRWLLKEDAQYARSVDELGAILAEDLSRQAEARAQAERGRERLLREQVTLAGAAKRLWAHLHQAAKEFWGVKVRESFGDPEAIRAIYNDEGKRNWAYSFGPEEWGGPARFDPMWSRHWRAQKYLEEIKKAGATNVLDVGIGPVYGTIYGLAGLRAFGLDVADVTLRHANEIAEKWGVGDKLITKQGWAQDLPWSDASFPAVVCGEVLEHVPDPEKVLAEGWRVLQPGGVLIATTPVGREHWDPMHVGPEQGGWNDASINALIGPYREHVQRLEKVGENGAEASCYLLVLRKPEVKPA